MPTTQTLPTGEIVVPMSTLLDALSAVLSPAERDALFEKLLMLRPQEVAPGDLITADLFNQILRDINDLMLRVASLEGTADATVVAPRIDSISPTIVRAGEQITVIGRGLSGTSLQSITIDNAQLPIAAIKGGSTDARMLLDAPPLLGLPVTGKGVILTVTNAAGSAQGSFTELPGQASGIQTELHLTAKDVTPAEAIKPAKNYTVNIEASIRSTRDESFDLQASVDGAGFEIVSVTPSKIDVTAASAAAAVVTAVQVVVKTGASGTGKVSLSLQSHNFVTEHTALNPPAELTVAAVVDLPSDKVLFGAALVVGPHSLDSSGPVPVIVAKANRIDAPLVHLRLPITLVDGGELKITQLATGDGKWPVTVASAPGGATSPGISNTVVIDLTPAHDSTSFTAPNSTLDFVVTNADGSEKRPFHALLAVRP